MITIFKTDKIKSTDEGQTIYGELRGLSTDTKPTEIGNKTIGNGSVFIEIDTQNVSIYNEDSQQWEGE